MRVRRKSAFDRGRDLAPVFAVIGLGIAGVFVAMNVLVSAVPIVTASSPSPIASTGPSFAATPSPLLLPTPTPLRSPAPTASLPSGGPTIINSPVSASDPGGNWSVYMLYPAFEEGTTPWAAAISADIGGDVETRALQWEAGPAAYRRASGKVNTLFGSFRTELLSSALASFTLTWTDDSSTGEPALGVETLTYDLGTGQRIQFNPLFTDSKAALTIVSGAALSLLQTDLGADYNASLAVEGTSPLPANYTHWALTPDGIKFIFSQYQVASSRDKLPEIVIPWATLRPVMITTGPVAQLAGF
jgi:Protein of unknown function (DUF3298)